MSLTNAERQARYRNRQKPFLKLANEIRLARRRIEYLEVSLIDVRDSIESLLVNLRNVFNTEE